MIPADATLLLAFIGQLDPVALPAKESDLQAKSLAWAATIVNMPLREAQMIATQHYARSSEPITPSHINAAWSDRQAVERMSHTELTDSHCGRSGCPCTHAAGCYKGWIDREGASTTPCRQCRPWTAERVSNVPGPGFRHAGDSARLRGEGVDRSTL